MGLFKLGEAFRELTDAVGKKDTAIASAKLVGKTLFNTGKIAFDSAVSHTERKSEEWLKRDDLSDEQRQNLERINKNSKSQRLRTDIKKLEEEIDELTSELNQEPDKEFETESRVLSLRRQIDSLQRKLDEV